MFASSTNGVSLIIDFCTNFGFLILTCVCGTLSDYVNTIQNEILRLAIV